MGGGERKQSGVHSDPAVFEGLGAWGRVGSGATGIGAEQGRGSGLLGFHAAEDEDGPWVCGRLRRCGLEELCHLQGSHRQRWRGAWAHNLVSSRKALGLSLLSGPGGQRDFFQP